jgi:hypothetical protein
MTGHVVTLVMRRPGDDRPRRLPTPTCDTCGRLTYACDPRQARMVATEHVTWTAANPAAPAALAAERAMDAASDPMHPVGSQRWRDRLLYLLPPVYADMPVLQPQARRAPPGVRRRPQRTR